MKCLWHLCTNELDGRQRAYCSLNCKNKYQVTKKRRGLKKQLVESAGGKCMDCDYVGPPFMFDFDHRDMTQKSFPISNFGKGTSIARLLEEAAKCDLVCARCHRLRTHKQRCLGCDDCLSPVG